MTPSDPSTLQAGLSGLYMFDPQLAAVLACPACYAPLRAESGAFACTVCQRLYPIVDGIPVLIAGDTPLARER